MIILTTQLMLLPRQEMVLMLLLILFGRLRRGLRINGADGGRGRVGHAVHARGTRHAICQTVGTEVSALQRRKSIGGHLTRTWEGSRSRLLILRDANLARPREQLHLGLLGLDGLVRLQYLTVLLIFGGRQARR